MPKLSIIIPVYNEELQLKNKINQLKKWKNIFSDDLELIIIDSNSTDNSNVYFSSLKSEGIAEIFYLSTKDPVKRSIGSALLEACELAKAELIMILPVDIFIIDVHINKVMSLKFNHTTWGCFVKKYESENLIMKFYAYLQNQFLTTLLQQAVWTNVFFFNKRLSEKIPTDGFLEDVLFCDRLKQISSGQIIKSKVVVSVRKYTKDGLSKRIVSNGIIILLYRCGYQNISVLKDFYTGKIGFKELLEKISGQSEFL